MNKLLLTFCCAIALTKSFSQTNTFPSSGNVGIGTTSPTNKLDIVESSGANTYVTVSNNAIQTLFGPAGNVFGIIGTTTNHDLAVYTNQNEKMRVTKTGNVGIGIASPTAKLEILGGTAWTSSSWLKSIKLNLAQAIQWSSNNAKFGIGASNPDALYFFSTTAEDTSQPANYIMAMLQNGNVGIGTITPDTKLSVNGKIRSQEIKVENANWPDYVFTRAYELPSLQETEKQIQETGHLSGIPSAIEVKANGIDLGEMNAKLLQKVEELTLYLIEKNKEDQAKSIKIEDLEKRLKKLEK